MQHNNLVTASFRDPPNRSSPKTTFYINNINPPNKKKKKKKQHWTPFYEKIGNNSTDYQTGSTALRAHVTVSPRAHCIKYTISLFLFSLSLFLFLSFSLFRAWGPCSAGLAAGSRLTPASLRGACSVPARELSSRPTIETHTHTAERAPLIRV